jgi:hypothetical protein
MASPSPNSPSRFPLPANSSAEASSPSNRPGGSASRVRTAETFNELAKAIRTVTGPYSFPSKLSGR